MTGNIQTKISTDKEAKCIAHWYEETEKIWFCFKKNFSLVTNNEAKADKMLKTIRKKPIRLLIEQVNISSEFLLNIGKNISFWEHFSTKWAEKVDRVKYKKYKLIFDIYEYNIETLW